MQLCGGACALAVAMLSGPRQRRFEEHEGKQFGVSSMPNVFLGAITLWLGFIAFDAGYAMGLDASTGLVILNATLAPAAGALVTFFASWIVSGAADLRVTIVGLLTANEGGGASREPEP